MTDVAMRTTPSRIGRAVAGITVALCAAVVLAFAGLIPLGPWSDEYFTVAHIRDDGLPFVLNRLLVWSPRPFSEFLVYAYSQAVAHWERPLVTPALVPLWLLFWGAVLLPFVGRRRAFVPALVLGCLLLLGHNVSEVFYWPISAFAYMPTLAAVVLILTLDWASLAKRPWTKFATMAALIIAACSSEVGATFCIGYCVLVGAVALLFRDKEGWWVVPPLVIAGGVLVMLTRGRVSTAMEVFGDPAVAHHPMIALQFATKAFVAQTVGSDAVSSSAISNGLVATSKVLFFLGIYLSLPLPSGQPALRQWYRLCLVAALIGSAWLTLAAAYNQFGMDCCLRHGTMRQGYVLVAIAALATALAAWRRPASLQTLGRVMLLGAIALPLFITAPKLESDYRNYARFVAARTALWASGRGHASTLVMPLTQPGEIVGGFSVLPGSYKAAQQNSPLNVQWILHFFGKSDGRFEPM